MTMAVHRVEVLKSSILLPIRISESTKVPFCSFLLSSNTALAASTISSRFALFFRLPFRCTKSAYIPLYVSSHCSCCTLFKSRKELRMAIFMAVSVLSKDIRCLVATPFTWSELAICVMT